MKHAEMYFLGDGMCEIESVIKGDTENGRIFTLADLFLEWYLFDSSKPKKDINSFLKKENLEDIFTETQFIDLMCGGAYLDDDTVLFVSNKLPFSIRLERIKTLNKSVTTQNSNAYLIKHTKSTIEKSRELIKQKRQRNRETYLECMRKSKRKYYLLNKRVVLERNKKWVLAHYEQYKTYQAYWRETNAEHLRQYHAQYRAQNAEIISKRKKKSYRANKEHYLHKNRENYRINKEKLLEQQRQHYRETKQKEAKAKTMCAAYVFLLNLRRTNKALYSTLYKGQSNPFLGMIKTCLALQNTDIEQCPFYNDKAGQSLQQCCNQKVLSLTNENTLIEILADILKQNQKS